MPPEPDDNFKVRLGYSLGMTTTAEGVETKEQFDLLRAELDQLLKLAERYCIGYQTIRYCPSVDVAISRV